MQARTQYSSKGEGEETYAEIWSLVRKMDCRTDIWP